MVLPKEGGAICSYSNPTQDAKLFALKSMMALAHPFLHLLMLSAFVLRNAHNGGGVSEQSTPQI
jgi:hypothetical protein